MKKRILIVDDEPRIRSNYVKLFSEGENSPFDVLEAADAIKATNLMIREKVDLILLDIKMPEINGRTLFDVIREYDPQLKVIISSVYSEDKQRELIPGAQEYYDKSQGPVRLLEKVVEVLQPLSS